MNNETETMDFDTGTLTEVELVEWARKIKEERNLSYAAISAEISPALGKAGKPYTTAYISNALNPTDGKTNGVRLAMAIISFYEGVEFDQTPRYKVA